MSSYHKLQQSWSFWYLKRQQQSAAKGFESYANNISLIGTFDTAEDFWGIYNHIVRPTDAPFPLDYHLFRQNVKPMWEDPENQNGGRFLVRVPRGKRISSRYWEDVVLALISGAFDVPDDEICGAVISSRHHFDMLSIWVKNKDSEEKRISIEETLKKVMKLPSNFKIEFKAHDEPTTNVPASYTQQKPNSPQKGKKRNNNNSNNKGHDGNKSDAFENAEEGDGGYDEADD